ncbi:MAG: hypothetical protein KAI47_01470, partial [Deltaproteobacteria bacterium]|nr:hypothetical protein [Deltaproteobacteria bacterium]
LYPRLRYSRFYARDPKDPGEPDRLAERVAGLFPVYMRLLGRFAKISLDPQKTIHEGREALTVLLTLRASPSAAPSTELAPAKRWRRSTQVSELKGRVLLDAKSGVPLVTQVKARWRYREPAGAPPASGIPAHLGEGWVTTTLDFAERLRPGPVAAIVPPLGKELVDIRRRRLEVERQMVQGERPLDPLWRARWGDIHR